MQPTNRSKYLPHAALMAVSLIYGANFTLAKQVMPLYIQPFGFILLRVILNRWYSLQSHKQKRPYR
jgi:hypothetical protein